MPRVDLVFIRQRPCCCASCLGTSPAVTKTLVYGFFSFATFLSRALFNYFSESVSGSSSNFFSVLEKVQTYAGLHLAITCFGHLFASSSSAAAAAAASAASAATSSWFELRKIERFWKLKLCGILCEVRVLVASSFRHRSHLRSHFALAREASFFRVI